MMRQRTCAALNAARKFAAIGISLNLLVLAAAPAAAQRRREEPQASPQFQQELNSAAPGAGGGPVDSGPPQASSSSIDEEPRANQGIQIGAASAARSSQAGAVSPLETRVSVRVKGAPLATFLDTISAQAKVNFIITEGLESKRVTAFLQNVTVREALQILLEIKGLTYQQIGKSNTYVIAPRSKTAETLITRIYTLAYVPLISLGDGTGTPGGSSSSADSGVAIIGVLKSVLSSHGQVALEPRTNALIVTDIPEVFPQVEQIIVELDKKAPQVMIEAQIVEIDSSRTKELGFDWGGSRGEIASFVPGTRETSFPLAMPSNLSRARFFDPLVNNVSGAGAEATASVSGASLTNGIFDLSQLAVSLRALVARSEARFLGKPKILTLNNKTATINLTNNSAISVQQNTSSVGGVGTASVQVERSNTGLTLRVTPQINKEGYITMLVQPSFISVQQSALGGNIFDTNLRTASTLVRVKNGQTLVLGGLLESQESKTVRKVPFFGYIPLLGWIFTSESVRRTNLDLVIFITPTIVGD